MIGVDKPREELERLEALAQATGNTLALEALEMVQKGLANWQDDRWSEMSRGMGHEDGEQLNSDEFHLRLFWRKWNAMMGAE